MIAYSIGILDDVQEGHSNSYRKAFWNSVAGTDVDSLEQYEELENENNGISKSIDDLKLLEARLNALIESKPINIDEIESKLKKERYENDIRRLYDTYLCNTYQTVDDWEQDTFYNICSFYKNEKYNCDTVFIQLNDLLPEKFEKIVIERIKGFFENDVYNIVENYNWVCHFGHGKSSDEKLELLDLELVDENGNLIKKYV